MKKINILGYNYTIDTTRPLEEMEGNVGYCDFDKLELRVANDVPEDAKNSTIIHEIIEAVNYHLEIGLEESQIKQLEVGIFQAFNDNRVPISLLLFEPFIVHYTGSQPCRCATPVFEMGRDTCLSCGGIKLPAKMENCD
jgi:hypothetical protein